MQLSLGHGCQSKSSRHGSFCRISRATACRSTGCEQEERRMFPRLLTTPFFTIRTFGVLLATAYIAALAWLVRGARRERLDAEAAMSLGMWAIVGALIGAKALLVLRTLGAYQSLSDLASIVTS